MKTQNKGITLIALAVTIIVMLILAGVTIATLTGDSGIITQASLSKVINELTKYKEEVELYKANKKLEDVEFYEESLTAGKDSINYNIKTEEEKGNIKNIIPDITNEYIEKLQIIKGELLIKTKDKKEIKAAQAVGIQINPYDITEDGELLSSTGNLLLVDSAGTLSLPDSVKKVGYGAFSGVEGLKTIIIPASVTEIGDYAFAYNQTLEKVVIEGNLTRIGNFAFDCVSTLSEINLPDSINYIGNYAFRSTNLSNVIIPKNVTKLNSNIFISCKLNKVTFQEGLESIGTETFAQTSISEISLPSTVNYISGTAFSNCTNLTSIDLSQNNNFIYEYGILLNKERDQIIFINKNVLNKDDTFIIPDGVVNFEVNISSYKNIKKIVLPSTLENISVNYLPISIENVEVKLGNNNLIAENKILYNKNNELIMCYSKEKNITIQEGIKKLKKSSFYFATNAEEINLPESLERIEDMVFSKNQSVKNINIGKNVNYINPYFKTNNYNGVVNIDENNPIYKVENDILYIKKNGKKDQLASVLYKIKSTIEIDPEVTTIGVCAFDAQTELTQIIIPEGVTTIMSGAFYFCPNLIKVEIPKTVNSIASNSFANATSKLEEIIIHNKENAISGAPWGAVKGMKVVKWVGK